MLLVHGLLCVTKGLVPFILSVVDVVVELRRVVQQRLYSSKWR